MKVNTNLGHLLRVEAGEAREIAGIPYLFRALVIQIFRRTKRLLLARALMLLEVKLAGGRPAKVLKDASLTQIRLIERAILWSGEVNGVKD